MIQIKMGKVVDTDRMSLIAKDAASNRTLFLDADRLYIYDHADGKRTLAGPYLPTDTLQKLEDWVLMPGMAKALERAGVVVPEPKKYDVELGLTCACLHVTAHSNEEAQIKAVKAFTEKVPYLRELEIDYWVRDSYKVN